MAEAAPIPVSSLPGIRRDGTRFESDQFIDGRWCRFNERGRPAKMGGYRAVTSMIPERIYGLSLLSNAGAQYMHLGGASSLTQVIMDTMGNLTGLNDRTPAGFNVSSDNVWQMDVLYDTTASIPMIVAHAVPNLAMIDNNIERPIYAGSPFLAAALTATGLDNVSGGIVAVPPYLIGYGNAGRVDVSAANNLAGATAGSAFVTGQKIVKGLPQRGTGQGPSMLLWSLDSLVRGTFDPSLVSSGVPFAFDTIAGDISILSSQGVIEYDGIFYWIANDRFMMYTGVVMEVPNATNIKWFFKNLNEAQRQKVFAFKIPRRGEIWWCFPFGTATDCTHAVIYNTRLRVWYDTQLPALGRTAGIFPKVYSKPFMVDNTETDDGFTLWQHETGTDAINGTDIQPIQSFFQSSEISALVSERPKSVSLRASRMEPDFVQTGPMTMTIQGRDNARATEQVSLTYDVPAPPTGSPQTETIPTKDVRRLMSFRFESNTSGGDYEMGRVLAHVSEGDGRTNS